MLTADLYAVLGVPPTATAHDIRRAYRRRALELHPDRNPGDRVAAEERFKALGAAYAVLSDPAQRAVYDAACWAPCPQVTMSVDLDETPPPDLGDDGDDDVAFSDPASHSARWHRQPRRPHAGVGGRPGCEHTGDGVYPDEGTFGQPPSPLNHSEEDYAAEGGTVDLHGDAWGARR